MKLLTRYGLTILLLIAATTAFSATGPTLRKGAAELGIGGSTILYGYNSSAVMNNPALLNRSSFRLDLLNLGIVADRKFFDMMKYASNNSDKFKSFDSLASTEAENARLQKELLDSMEPFDDQWNEVGLTPVFGVSWQHFGLTYANQTTARMKLDRGIMNPMAVLEGYTSGALYVGYGDQFSPYLHGEERNIEYGFTAKILSRREVSGKRVAIFNVTGTQDLQKQVQDDFTKTKSGFSIDAGAIHRLDKDWEVAAVMRDAIGSFDGKYLTPNLIVGAKYDFNHVLMSEDNIFSRWIILGEVEDMLNGTGTNFFYKCHLGSEAAIANRLKIRGGFNRGYPTWGMGLDLFLVKLDYSYYGDELGRQAGQLASYKHFMQVTLGW